jgi:hypothetical protein
MAKHYRLQRSQTIARPPREVFAFLSAEALRGA